MIYKAVRLQDIFPLLPGNKDVMLCAYVHSNSGEIENKRKYPSVLVLPGGGYSFTSDREAEPVAIRFFASGYNAYVLRYTTKPDRYPTQLLQASAAVAYIRTNTDWNNNGKVAVCGFSAGGHLAASIGTLWHEPVLANTLGLEPEQNRPDAMILGYPVITSDKYAHRGSIENLLGEDAPAEMFEKMSLENAADKQSAPAFIWHTATDTAVPVENSLMMAKALRDAGVSFELHIFPEGPHGLSMCDISTAASEESPMVNPRAAQWFDLCIKWLKGIIG